MKGESISWYLTTKLHGVHRKTLILKPHNDTEIITLFLNAVLNVALLRHRKLGGTKGCSVKHKDGRVLAASKCH